MIQFVAVFVSSIKRRKETTETWEHKGRKMFCCVPYKLLQDTKFNIKDVETRK